MNIFIAALSAAGRWLVERSWRFAATAVLLFCDAAAAAGEAGPWVLRHTDTATGTAVYLRERADGLTEFRAAARIQARLSTLTAVLLDIEQMPEWVYRARSVVSLERVSPTEGYNQVILAMPWPFDDREAIVHWQLVQDASSLAVTMRGIAAPDKLSPNHDYVRMPAFESHWRFSPLADGTVEIEFQGHGNPGGNLASPLLRAFVASAVWEAPLQTMLRLRGIVARSHAQAAFDFIREPER